MKDNNKKCAKKKYSKPVIEHSEKIGRVFLACRTAMGKCTTTLQQANTCPKKGVHC